MPLPIQRVPRGLSDVLSIFGGQTPQMLGPEVLGTLELIQFYGLTQRSTLGANNAAVAEGVNVPAPALTTWAVLFNATTTIIKTATVTALRGSVNINRGGGSAGLGLIYAQEELGPFGATETGAATVVFFPDYPLLLPPGTVIGGSAPIVGTDATVNLTIQAEIGVLG